VVPDVVDDPVIVPGVRYAVVFPDEHGAVILQRRRHGRADAAENATEVSPELVGEGDHDVAVLFEIDALIAPHHPVPAAGLVGVVEVAVGRSADLERRTVQFPKSAPWLTTQ
jgi:hypothetical protein